MLSSSPEPRLVTETRVRRIHLASSEALSTKGHCVVWAEGNPVLLVEVDGQVLALQGTCSHEQYSLEEGWVEGETITCPAHSSRFDLRTGQVLDPPAHLPLARYQVVVEEGHIYLDIEGRLERNE